MADWQAIRNDYENGLSLRQLSAKYNISKSAIGERKYKEQWTAPDRQADRWTAKNTQETIHSDINASVRALAGFKLRYEENKTWEEVAAGAGYASRGAARNAVLRESHRHIGSEMKEIRDEEYYRLTQLQMRCYKVGISPASKEWTWAIDRFVSLSKRKSELMGLDVKPDELIGVATVIRSYGTDVSKV